MATTELGKELRRLRIDKDERLLDMADRLEKSSAFISAVETGKKSPPSDFEELVIRAYRLIGDAANRIRQAADRSRKTFTLQGDTDLQRDTFGLMARKMHTLSDDELNQIFQLLKGGGAKDGGTR
ncbi:helix-turn-helix domain-containing protein [Xinfangfangia pollutisoli]|uniref:helix-turn-helix domain-containing protein n=1 Tax=Xinfangfangia pollutisoli TaxID=2865960 RepID=UPI001CD70779|nr:helix-turn-helix domain-containing protein [Xinfangfangia pollutisoli]